ncbi:unnamed protein product [Closterium sp. NIES-64]|nr:unnamed protein product [Closterium sp. NIES-64]
MDTRHHFPAARHLACFASFASPTPSLTPLVVPADPAAPTADDPFPCAANASPYASPGAEGSLNGDGHSEEGSADAENVGDRAGRVGRGARMCEEYVAACAAVMRHRHAHDHHAPSASASAASSASAVSSAPPVSPVSPAHPWIELAAETSSDVTTDISSDVSAEIRSGMSVSATRRPFGSPITMTPASSAASSAAAAAEDSAAADRYGGKASDGAAWWGGGGGEDCGGEGRVVQQFHVRTEGLSYTAVNGRTILNRVSVAAHPGQLLALAGPSGSGKTSLLDAIGCRIDPGSLSGSILVNDRPMPPSFRKHSAYVLQDDALFALLSVRETLDFAARLRLPSTVTPAARQQRVQQLVQQLGLTACADTPVGDDLVSGPTRWVPWMGGDHWVGNFWGASKAAAAAVRGVGTRCVPCEEGVLLGWVSCGWEGQACLVRRVSCGWEGQACLVRRVSCGWEGQACLVRRVSCGWEGQACLHRGVSGGERRRTSIGVELIHNPAVLLLDEPTSGLDSASALKVVQLLHNMAVQGGRTVVLTIHQPSFRITALLHRMALLISGTVAFHGATPALRCHLAVLHHPVPPHVAFHCATPALPQVNLLEFALDTLPRIAAAATRAKSEAHTDTPPAAPSLGAALKHQLGKLLGRGKGCSGGGGRGEGSGASEVGGVERGAGERAVGEWEYATSAVSTSCSAAAATSHSPARVHAAARASRALHHSHRQPRRLSTTPTLPEHTLPMHMHMRAWQVAMGVIMGSLFLHVGFDMPGLQSRFAVLGFTIALVFYNSLDALPLFYLERTIFTRETSRGAYRTAPYVVATTLTTLPLCVLLSLALATPLYWMVGLAPSASAFLVFIATLCLAFALANAFVTLLSALLPSHMVAATVASSAFSFFLLFSGFFFSNAFSCFLLFTAFFFSNSASFASLMPTLLLAALSLPPSHCRPLTAALSLPPSHCLPTYRCLLTPMCNSYFSLAHLHLPLPPYRPTPPTRAAIPGYWLWLYYVSLMRYPMELLLWAEFHHGLGPTCFSTFSPAAGVGYTASGTNEACGLTGAAYLDARGFTGLSPWRNLLVILAFIAALRLAFYAALRRHAASTRK